MKNQPPFADIQGEKLFDRKEMNACRTEIFSSPGPSGIAT